MSKDKKVNDEKVQKMFKLDKNLQEYLRSKIDPVYFIENYIYIFN